MWARTEASMDFTVFGRAFLSRPTSPHPNPTHRATTSALHSSSTFPSPSSPSPASPPAWASWGPPSCGRLEPPLPSPPLAAAGWRRRPRVGHWQRRGPSTPLFVDSGMGRFRWRGRRVDLGTATRPPWWWHGYRLDDGAATLGGGCIGRRRAWVLSALLGPLGRRGNGGDGWPLAGRQIWRLWSFSTSPCSPLAGSDGQPLAAI